MKSYFSLIGLSMLVGSQVIVLCLGDESDHDHEDHSCHWGYYEGFGYAVVEDECNYIDRGVAVNGFVFECVDNTTGMFLVYDNIGCNGNETSSYVLDTEGAFDCSTVGQCTVASLTSTQYGAGDSDCSGDATLTFKVYATSGASCVNNLNGAYLGYSVEADILLVSEYSDSDCASFVSSSGFRLGCQPLGGLYIDSNITIIGSSDDDDDKASILQVYGGAALCIALLFAFVL